MKRVARTVILSAVVISAVTGALAVAETGRYPSVKQIPTVLTSQRASTIATTAPEVAVAAPVAATAPAAPAPKAAPAHKSNGGSTSRRSAPAKKVTPTPPPAPKKTESSHPSSREVVNHSVRDESSEHSPSGTSQNHPKPSSSTGDSTNH